MSYPWTVQTSRQVVEAAIAYFAEELEQAPTTAGSQRLAGALSRLRAATRAHVAATALPHGQGPNIDADDDVDLLSPAEVTAESFDHPVAR